MNAFLYLFVYTMVPCTLVFFPHILPSCLAIKRNRINNHHNGPLSNGTIAQPMLPNHRGENNGGRIVACGRPGCHFSCIHQLRLCCIEYDHWSRWVKAVIILIGACDLFRVTKVRRVKGAMYLNSYYVLSRIDVTENDRVTSQNPFWLKAEHIKRLYTIYSLFLLCMTLVPCNSLQSFYKSFLCPV